jgi:hypothetical protein
MLVTEEAPGTPGSGVNPWVAEEAGILFATWPAGDPALVALTARSEGFGVA